MRYTSSVRQAVPPDKRVCVLIPLKCTQLTKGGTQLDTRAVRRLPKDIWCVLLCLRPRQAQKRQTVHLRVYLFVRGRNKSYTQIRTVQHKREHYIVCITRTMQKPPQTVQLRVELLLSPLPVRPSEGGVHTYVYVYVYKYVCIYIYIYICIYVYNATHLAARPRCRLLLTQAGGGRRDINTIIIIIIITIIIMYQQYYYYYYYQQQQQQQQQQLLLLLFWWCVRCVHYH